MLHISDIKLSKLLNKLHISGIKFNKLLTKLPIISDKNLANF